MAKITQVVAREILDSRGNPTLETSIMTDIGVWATASVPAGASTGSHEAKELRDGDPQRYHGLGVIKAVNKVNQVIGPALKGFKVGDQLKLDSLLLKLDGTPDKSNLGANSILSVSIAGLKLAANLAQKPLFLYIHQTFAPKLSLKIPVPTYNLINGGKHGAGYLNFQEFHLVSSSKLSFSQSLRLASETIFKLKQLFHQQGLSTAVGDEGGFSPKLDNDLQALDLLQKVLQTSSYQLGQDIFLGFDFAANDFFNEGLYSLKGQNKPLSASELSLYYQKLLQKYPLHYLEDPFQENDWPAWQAFQTKLPQGKLLVGDDLLTTNPKLLQKAIKEKACNAILIKPNQIGTIIETLQTISIAKQHSFKFIVSHRSGETNDSFIADFAVGLGADYVKFGAPVRGERVAKYNRLLEIETYLNRLSQN